MIHIKDIIDKLEGDMKVCKKRIWPYPPDVYYSTNWYIEDLLKWIKSNLEEGGKDE